jgi:hypothetical protein
LLSFLFVREFACSCVVVLCFTHNFSDVFPVVLGKLAAERDQLREEVTRLQRITSTIAPAAGAAGAKRSPVASAAGGSAGTSSRGAAAGKAIPVTGGAKEKQQASTNVLVIELNNEVIFSLF